MTQQLQGIAYKHFEGKYAISPAFSFTLERKTPLAPWRFRNITSDFPAISVLPGDVFDFGKVTAGTTLLTRYWVFNFLPNIQ